DAFNLELVGAQEFVVVRVVEGDNLYRLPLTTGTQVLFNGQVVHQQVIDGLVVLHQACVIRVGELAHNFAQAFVTDPWIQPDHGSFQPFGQHHIPVVAPFTNRCAINRQDRREVCTGNVGPAKAG